MRSIQIITWTLQRVYVLPKFRKLFGFTAVIEYWLRAAAVKKKKNPQFPSTITVRSSDIFVVAYIKVLRLRSLIVAYDTRVSTNEYVGVEYVAPFVNGFCSIVSRGRDDFSPSPLPPNSFCESKICRDDDLWAQKPFGFACALRG